MVKSFEIISLQWIAVDMVEQMKSAHDVTFQWHIRRYIFSCLLLLVDRDRDGMLKHLDKNHLSRYEAWARPRFTGQPYNKGTVDATVQYTFNHCTAFCLNVGLKWGCRVAFALSAHCVLRAIKLHPADKGRVSSGSSRNGAALVGHLGALMLLSKLNARRFRLPTEN
ncbi:hypothetical protein CEXT_458001 [Caerostris extrusa]|uniref:Uncharacterized protein n=1 Tax=Caerostris extrusa TaxID=172846 RepID=A0AAV4WV18_CAEEX|nr:hypothetical protein CEXT_458001 [Caerostris extrusa]